jgi:hypothetical protein
VLTVTWYVVRKLNITFLEVKVRCTMLLEVDVMQLDWLGELDYRTPNLRVCVSSIREVTPFCHLLLIVS